MNTINFNDAGGFPLETNTLDNMQGAYSIFNAFGELAGNKTIVKGCITTGSTVSGGYIYLNGELLAFQGGTIQATIIIREIEDSRTFEDGVSRPIYKKRWAEFGAGTGSTPWSDFKRTYPLSSALYIDKVDMYAGDIANIPTGWHLCDGTNGTKDLRGRFIVGLDPTDTDYDTIGKVGGLKDVVLTELEMPAHKHEGSTNSAGLHNHYGHVVGASGDWKGGGSNSYPNATSTNGYTNDGGTHSHSINTNNKGGDQAHENRPPYFTLAYIQFKGI